MSSRGIRGNTTGTSNVGADFTGTALNGEKFGLDTASTGYGTTDVGSRVALSATAEGHQEIAIHSPRLPFGSIHAERLAPVFQVDAIYQLNHKLINWTDGRAIAGSGSGSNSVANNYFTCSTGTTSYSFATIQSRRRLRYRPGQGIVGRFAGYFNTGVASSIQVMGFGTAEAGFYFGYNGTSFGILHVTGGVREIHTLTITTASTATNNYVVTLPNGTTVNVTATNNGSTTATAYEISKGTYPGWSAMQEDSTVIFLKSDAGASGGSFSLAQTGAGTPAAGSDVTTVAGVSSTDTWIPQSSWNGADILDGNGASGATLDPTKGNVYEIGIQYLGAGTIEFRIESAPSGNNPDFITVHTIRYPNTATTTSVSQPSFPFTMAAYSAGSTTDVTVRCSSFAGFVEGDISYLGPRHAYRRETSGFVGSTANTYYPLFTIKNGLTYAGRANQSIIHLLSVSCAHDDATPVSFVLLRGATLGGAPNFARYASDSSPSLWDITATTATISDNDLLEFSVEMGQSAGGVFNFDDKEITIQPGEAVTLAARAVTGTATYVNASINTREDQ